MPNKEVAGLVGVLLIQAVKTVEDEKGKLEVTYTTEVLPDNDAVLFVVLGKSLPEEVQKGFEEVLSEEEQVEVTPEMLETVRKIKQR